jgi:hypothetical protein
LAYGVQGMEGVFVPIFATLASPWQLFMRHLPLGYEGLPSEAKGQIEKPRRNLDFCIHRPSAVGQWLPSVIGFTLDKKNLQFLAKLAWAWYIVFQKIISWGGGSRAARASASNKAEDS